MNEDDKSIGSICRNKQININLIPTARREKDFVSWYLQLDE